MNINKMGNSYMDMVNRVMEMISQSTPGNDIAQADANLQQQGIGLTDPRYVRDPQLQQAIGDMAMGASTNTPKKLDQDMVRKLLSGKAVTTIRPSEKYLKQQMDDIINRVLANRF